MNILKLGIYFSISLHMDGDILAMTYDCLLLNCHFRTDRYSIANSIN